MENKNLVALNALTALQNTFRSESLGKQVQADALQVAVDIINDLYHADTAWVEEAKVKAQEEVKSTVKELTNRAETAETNFADAQILIQELTTLAEEAKVKAREEVEQLTTRAETAEAALSATPDTTASDTPATVDTIGTTEGTYETDNMGNVVIKK